MAENDPFCYPYHIDYCMPQEKWSKGLDQHSETLPRNSRKGAGSTSEKPLDAKLNVKKLEDEISNKDMNLSPILKSIKELEKAAIKINDQKKEIEASKGWKIWKEYQMKVRDVNDRLMMAERAFTDRDGLLGMTWHKHLGSNF